MSVESAATSKSRWGMVEWVVILAIILILTLLLVPVPHRLPPNGEKVQAQNTAYNLKNAISSYYTEYRRYPVSAKDVDALLHSDHELMDVLLGSDQSGSSDGLNPRKIAFYIGKSAKPMENGRFRKGVTLDGYGAGELWDPWGNHYRILLDSDLDNGVDNPDYSAGLTRLPESILVWSAGPDGDFDTWEDNPTTWQ